jgi:dihydrodipicolinate synthase/N-acetylneuraminate lyase
MTSRPLTWGGIYPAALTMFDRHGALDCDAFAAHLDHLVVSGAHGVVVAGTSGEFVSLTEAERRQVIEIAVATVAGRIPVVAGTGFSSTSATLALTQVADDLGADGVIVILPYFVIPTVAEIMEHFRALRRVTSLPIMVYNNPRNSAAPPLSSADLAVLYADGVVQAVKSTFPTVHQVHELRHATDDDFRVFYGSFVAPLEGFTAGAHGWISGILNVAVTEALELWQAVAVDRDLDAAQRAMAKILPLKYLYTQSILGAASDLVIYRALLDLRGQHGGHSRAPLAGLRPDQRAHLAEYAEKHGLV